MKDTQKLFGERQVDIISASRIKEETHQVAASLETIQVLALVSQSIICRYNWISDYTIIMLVRKNQVNSQNKQGALGQSECW